MYKLIKSFAAIIFVLALYSSLYAEENKQQGMPPAQVVVATVASGMVAPEIEFVGTAYYQETSDVASEVSGKVAAVNFDEGDRVKENDVLVQLNSELLQQDLMATFASYEQALSELEQANSDLERAENLSREKLISSQDYDTSRFKVKSLEKKAQSLKADAGRFEIELQKTAIKAPYDGLVIKKNVDIGEWLSSESTAMTIAMDDYMVPVVHVPSRIVKYIKAGLIVDVTIDDNVIKGKVVAIVPKGDTSTRTVPVKIGIPNTLSLIEGMEIRVSLPSGKKEKALIVPREAVITAFGSTVVYAVNDSSALMIPATVIGYQGMKAGIRAEGLSEGMQVVIKGNERLRPGQPVMIQQ